MQLKRTLTKFIGIFTRSRVFIEGDDEADESEGVRCDVGADF